MKISLSQLGFNDYGDFRIANSVDGVIIVFDDDRFENLEISGKLLLVPEEYMGYIVRCVREHIERSLESPVAFYSLPDHYRRKTTNAKKNS